MPTPTYQGPGQPAADNGSWFGALGSLLGGTTPAYAGEGQPTGGSSGFLSGTTPAYAPAPTQPTVTRAPDAVTVCPIDSGAFAAGQIAIVIPRNE